LPRTRPLPGRYPETNHDAAEPPLDQIKSERQAKNQLRKAAAGRPRPAGRSSRRPTSGSSSHGSLALRATDCFEFRSDSADASPAEVVARDMHAVAFLDVLRSLGRPARAKVEGHLGPALHLLRPRRQAHPRLVAVHSPRTSRIRPGVRISSDRTSSSLCCGPCRPIAVDGIRARRCTDSHFYVDRISSIAATPLPRVAPLPWLRYRRDGGRVETGAPERFEATGCG
jgi:hypothetical protein